MIKRRLRFFLFSRECVQFSPDAKMFTQTTVILGPYRILCLFILCRRPLLTLDVNRSTRLDLPLSSLSFALDALELAGLTLEVSALNYPSLAVRFRKEGVLNNMSEITVS